MQPNRHVGQRHQGQQPQGPVRQLTDGWSPLRRAPVRQAPGATRISASGPLPPAPGDRRPRGHGRTALQRLVARASSLGKLPRAHWYPVAIVVGLAAGLALWAVLGRTGTAERQQDGGRAAPVPEAVAAPVLDCPAGRAAPGSAAAALEAFLQAEASGEPSRSYALLTSASRVRYPTLGAWISARPNRLRPVAFCLRGERPGGAGAVELEVAATHRSSLDPFVGLVPARSVERWLVTREQAGWRVAADPRERGYVLPADQSAARTAGSWVEHLASCDAGAAQRLQTGRRLYGPANLPARPCKERGRWTAADALTLDHAPDAQALLAAFGPDVLTWGRVVPVRGPRTQFYAALAPVGEGWRVMGVLSDGERR